jgi:hypothetical protein
LYTSPYNNKARSHAVFSFFLSFVQIINIFWDALYELIELKNFKFVHNVFLMRKLRKIQSQPYTIKILSRFKMFLYRTELMSNYTLESDIVKLTKISLLFSFPPAKILSR